MYQQGNFTEGQTLPHATQSPCVVPVNSTHFFIGGGTTTNKKAYFLEVSSWTWTQLTDMVQGRTDHTCGKIGRDIHVVGGDQNPDALDTTEIFNLDTLTWSAGPRAPVCCEAAVYQGEDTFYIIGGVGGDTLESVYRFDEASFSWKLSDEKKLETARSQHVVVTVPVDVIPTSVLYQ